MQAVYADADYQVPTGSSKSKPRRASSSKHASRSSHARGACSTTALTAADLPGFQPGSPASSSLLPSSEEWMAMEAAGGLDSCYLLEGDELEAAAIWPFLHNSSSATQGPHQHQHQHQHQQQQPPRSAAALGSGATSPNVSSGTTTGTHTAVGGAPMHQGQPAPRQQQHQQHQQQQQQQRHHMHRPHSYEQLSAEQQQLQPHVGASGRGRGPGDRHSSCHTPPPCQLPPGAPSAQSVVPGPKPDVAAYQHHHHHHNQGPHPGGGWPRNGPLPPHVTGMAGGGHGFPAALMPGGPGDVACYDSGPQHHPLPAVAKFLPHSSRSSHFGSMEAAAGQLPGSSSGSHGFHHGPGGSSYDPSGSGSHPGGGPSFPGTAGMYPGPAGSGAPPLPGAPPFHPQHSAMGHQPGMHPGMHAYGFHAPAGFGLPHMPHDDAPRSGGGSGGGFHPGLMPLRGPGGGCDLLGCICNAVHAPPPLSVGPVPAPFPPGAPGGPHPRDVYGSYHAASAEPGYHSYHQQHQQQHQQPPHHQHQLHQLHQLHHQHMLEASSSGAYAAAGPLGGSHGQHPAAELGFTPPGATPMSHGYSGSVGAPGMARPSSSRDPRPFPGAAAGAAPGGGGLAAGGSSAFGSCEDAVMMSGSAPGSGSDGDLKMHPGLRPLRIAPQCSVVAPPAASLAAAAAAAMVEEVSNAVGAGDSSAFVEQLRSAAAAEAGPGDGLQLQALPQMAGSQEHLALARQPDASHSLQPAAGEQQQQQAAANKRSWEQSWEPSMQPAAGPELVTAASAAELTDNDAAAAAAFVPQLAPMSSGSGSEATMMDAAEAAAAPTDPAAAAAAPVDLSLLPGYGQLLPAAPGSLSQSIGGEAGMAIDLPASSAATAADKAGPQQEAASLDPAAAAALPVAAVAARPKGSVKGKKGGGSKKSSAAAAGAAAASGAAKAAGQKRKNDQAASKGSKAAKTSGKDSPDAGGSSQPKVQRYLKDMQDLRQQFNTLRTTNTQIKVQVLTLQLAKTELLSRLAELTSKWRSTVADNMRLQQENEGVRAQIAQAQQQLMTVPPRRAQQPSSQRPRHRLPWLQQHSRCQLDEVPRAHSV